MIRKSAAIRVIFNDAHANLPSSLCIPQGGVSSFAKKFSSYFDKKDTNIELVSLLFSHNPDSKKIYIKETVGNHKYYELYYPREELLKSYKRDYTKKEYTKFLEPWLKQLDEVFEKINPDIVFLNGFSLSNWLILETAHRRHIPICIQHAGIWKKELSVSQSHFSSSIKRIFCSYEKEIYKKASHMIFLNKFSRDVFFSIHNIPKNVKNLYKTSIVSLPIEIDNFKKIKIEKKPDCKIGVVARWDRIKNHDAILRLAKYIENNSINASIEVVTSWGLSTITEYKKEYSKFVKIINPMPEDKLKDFYKSEDIIMIPSRFDVSPNVLMEAFSCGKPVIISSNVGWVSDYIKFNLKKLVISPYASGKNIYCIIEELKKNNISYTNKFNKMQEKIIINNNTQKVFMKYHNIFKKLLK